MKKYTYWLYKTKNYERFPENINNNTLYSCGYLSGNQISRIKKTTPFKVISASNTVILDFQFQFLLYSWIVIASIQQRLQKWYNMFIFLFRQNLDLIKSVHKGKEQFTYPQITIITNWKFKFAVWACTCLSLVDNNPADGIFKALENVGHDHLKLHVDI